MEKSHGRLPNVAAERGGRGLFLSKNARTRERERTRYPTAQKAANSFATNPGGFFPGLLRTEETSTIREIYEIPVTIFRDTRFPSQRSGLNLATRILTSGRHPDPVFFAYPVQFVSPLYCCRVGCRLYDDTRQTTRINGGGGETNRN